MNLLVLTTAGALKKKLLVGILALIAIAVLTGGIYMTWLLSPPPPPQTMAESVVLLKSPRFKRLPGERKTEYMQHISELRKQMDPAQRQVFREQHRDDHEYFQARREVWTEMIHQHVRKFAQADPAQRTVILDGILQRIEGARDFSRRSQRPARDADRKAKRSHQYCAPPYPPAGLDYYSLRAAAPDLRGSRRS